MFDQSTLDLLDSSPKFKKVNISRLPQELTDSYTRLVGVRLRLKEFKENDDLLELKKILHETRSLALIFESYVAVHEDNEHTSAAAFISASAHHLCITIEEFLLGETVYSELLSDRSISPVISAAVLFFVAGYTADASEIAAKIQPGQTIFKNTLSNSLKQLLTGKTEEEPSEIDPKRDFDVGPESHALNVLWGELYKGVNLLISAISGQIENTKEAFSNARSIFSKVLELSSFEYTLRSVVKPLSLTSVYYGPRHLAKLLLIMTGKVQEFSIISISTPREVHKRDWFSTLKHFSLSRPYLWPNHIEAIGKKFLDPGISSVLSFPTGGGKSTTAELKIAATLLRGFAVLFVVPTLALVDQVAKTLRDAFPLVKTTLNIEEFGIDDIEIEVQPDILVMTPESCLARMAFNPEIFENIGLFVFDECHLIHSRSESYVERRSLDAMFCILRMIVLKPETDLLLMSAMLANGQELAEWISNLNGRPCLSLDYTWKPTRQAKGCVVYNSSEIAELNRYIKQDADKTPKNRLTAESKRNLKATPFSFFSLNQTWHSNSANDYKLVKLSDEPCNLGANNYNRLTPNRNKNAASIAISSSRAGIKTLIFTSTKKDCDSIVKEASYNRIDKKIKFTEYEKNLLELIELEFGALSHTYCTKESSSLPHHGLLTKQERRLHESLFKRPNGVDILVATSTLAQGINLPAQCVIIAGDTRFDVQQDKIQDLDAHELLNAAGRAGRAGQSSSGFVLVIPSKVIQFNAKENKITRHWMQLKSVFSQSDQCLTVEDPIGLILDKIHEDPDSDDGDVRYFLKKIPQEDDSRDAYINKTFRVYKRRVEGEQSWIQSRLSAASSAQKRLNENSSETEDTDNWISRLSTSSGIDQAELILLRDDAKGNIFHEIDSFEILKWLIFWLTENTKRLDSFIRQDTLDQELKKPFTDFDSNKRLKYIRENLLKSLCMWIQGKPLNSIEAFLSEGGKKSNHCDRSRRLSIRIVPEFSYAAGILSQVYRNEMGGDASNLSLMHAGQWLRIGLDNPYKLALHYILKDETARVSTHSLFDLIAPYISYDENRDFGNLMSTIRTAYNSYLRNR